MIAKVSQLPAVSGFDVRYYGCHDDAAPVDRMTPAICSQCGSEKSGDEFGVFSVALGANSAAIYLRI